METLRLTERELASAAAFLKAGKLVAFPTETVYGLGAPIFSLEAVTSLFLIKGRPLDNPLIAHISSLDQVGQIARDIPEPFYRIAEAFFPGPLTVVLSRHPDVPPAVSAGLETIAFRMPAHPLARALIELVGEPLVAPSANLSGRPSPTRSEHVLEDFEGKISAVLDGGRTQYGIESTVLSLIGEKPVLLRPGTISPQEISRVLGCEIGFAEAGSSDSLASPGMRHRHYAPRTPVRLFQDEDSLCSYIDSHPLRCFLLLSRGGVYPNVDCLPLSAPELYAGLRHADTHGYDEVLIYCDSVISSDIALMNRILRASGI